MLLYTYIIELPHIRRSYACCIVMLPAGVVRVTSIVFSLQSDPFADTPKFTLTCTSTGGPTTYVIWTQDGVDTGAGPRIPPTVDDQQNATYRNAWIPIPARPGSYQCNISNDRTIPPATASLNVSGE